MDKRLPIPSNERSDGNCFNISRKSAMENNLQLIKFRIVHNANGNPVHSMLSITLLS